ncbi:MULTISPECIES: ribonuclease P protein subunit [Acidianus]|uniref:Ribonuclease P protein component 1 n=1 Tax=Candidatus Acidianus copahuensis TaxID=1160895 RepID=A0A031LN52_9CREN|nr:ribonuclease P [Candidatus Acidianus copahuensis]NON62514.1 ribonuclease P protein subunit [Acidianus sp. RZ1]
MKILDLIGLKITVLYHSNPYYINISGIIVFESRNFLYIRDHKGKIKRIYKMNGIYQLDFKGSHMIVHGCRIVGSPIKRIYKRRWSVG